MGKLSVLVIEDEDKIREALEYTLRFDGFKVLTAPGGRSGITLAQSKKPDLVLLDWMMPEFDGMRVLYRLKHDDKTKKIPVFMMTAKGMLGDIDEAFDNGADDYITKPFDPNTLAKLVLDKYNKYKQSI